MSAPATHTALLHDGGSDYARAVGGFLRDALERGHRTLVMAPPARMDLVRSELGSDADEVTFVEDGVAYAPQWNAYRVLLDFTAAAPGVRSCVVAEQALSVRVPPEVVDYRRLESAANLVFAERAVDLLCPYDTVALPPHLLDIALATHASVLADGVVVPNPGFHDPLALLRELAAVVTPPGDAVTLDCASPSDISLARRMVRLHGAEAGLRPDLVADMALAVTEVLTNALVHGAPPALVHIYDEEATWVCHVQDGGAGLADPLTGLLPPAQPSDHGYGLWLARQLCAAVDVGNDLSETHVRLHARVG
jgi:anti-sigma regulatory factor (Ser/Thr protein kinase)